MELLEWDDRIPPVELRRAKAAKRLLEGDSLKAIKSELAVSPHHVSGWAEEISTDGIAAWLGRPNPDEARLKRAREGIAQMLLGKLAEKHFETLALERIGDKGFRLEDQTVGRTDTDYRLIDPDGRPLFRLNIKFHGTLFAAAQEYVSLAPADCFALATYKIEAALRRQEEEALPYLFLIISVPDFPRETVVQSIRHDWAWLAAISGRIVEEAIVRRLAKESWVEPIKDRIRMAQFRVISARRAFNLMRDQLFQRVHALRLRAFNRLFRGAEINMHLSLSNEMVTYVELVDMLISRGPVEIALRLDRGEI